MFTIIAIGAIAVIGLLIIAFMLLERAIAYKAAAGIVGLYLSLIGLGYFQSTFERNDSSFAKEQSEMKLNFAQAQQDIFRQLDGLQIPDEERVKRDERLKRLQAEYADASSEAKAKKDLAEQKSLETREAVESLTRRAKRAVDEDEAYLPLAKGGKGEKL